MSKSVTANANGISFLIETDDSVDVPGDFASSSPGRTLEGIPDGMDAVASVGQLGDRFAEVQELIVTCCNSLYDSLSRLPHPERISVEFGVKLGGEAGVPMLTKASGEANFKISVEWKPTP